MAAPALTLAASELALEGPATFKKPARYWQLRRTTSYLKARPRDGCPRGGSLKYLLPSETAKMLGEDWHDAPEDELIETYEYLRGLVDKNRADGWTTRI